MSSIETRIIVLSRGSSFTLGKLLTMARSLNEPVVIKKTCYGIIVEGEREVVKRVVRVLKDSSPYDIFTKQRGYRVGDMRKCRKGEDGLISGAPRTGFHQLEKEMQMMLLIGKAMEVVDFHDQGNIVSNMVGELTVDEVRSMVRLMLAEDNSFEVL